MSRPSVHDADRRPVLLHLAAAIITNGLEELASGGLLSREGVARRWWDNCRHAGLTPAGILSGLRALSHVSATEAREAAYEAVEVWPAPLPVDRAGALTRLLAHTPGWWQRRLWLVAPHGPPAAPHDLKPFVLPRAPRFLPGHRPRGVGDLELEAYLGGGGHREVYRARSYRLRTAPMVAFKCSLADEGARLMLHEARVLDDLRCRGCTDGIVQVRDTFSTADVPAATFEWIDGLSLQEVLEAYHRVNTRPPVRIILGYLVRLAEVLGRLHRCLYVHRDIKPANILLAPGPGGSWQPFLIDFGIAGPAGSLCPDDWEVGAATRWLIDRVLANGGSRFTASPQQLAGQLCHPSDDVYSTAVAAVQALTGTWNRRVEEFGWAALLGQHQVPATVIRLLQECVDPQPHRRPADGNELHERLLDLAGEAAA